MAIEGYVVDRLMRRYRRILYRVRSRNPRTTEPRSCGVRAGGLFFAPEDRDAFRRIYETRFRDGLPGEVARGSEYLKHSFEFLGHRAEHGPGVRWSMDPVSGLDWPGGFSLDIPYKGPKRPGDIKLAWELNKHQHFFTLGKLWWLTGRERYRDELLAEMDSWIEDNPPYRGINWISALEMGMRVVSWITAYPFYSGAMDEGLRLRMTGSMHSQLEFIEENLSSGAFPNTHLIGEAASLVIGGLFLDSPKSDRWVAVGMEILASQARDLSHPDGVYREQSLNYQRFFLDYYYLVLALDRRGALACPGEVSKKVEDMTGFLMYALTPEGGAPAFGDADDARGIYVKEGSAGDYRGLLALGAVLFGRQDFRLASGAAAEELLWLLGPEAVSEYLDIAPDEPRAASRLFPDGGYAFMRSGWDEGAAYLAFDCGPLGHGPAGHGHADALSFQLHANGFACLVDPGTYSYNLDYAWRDSFRSTAAHNTVTVDGLDQSEMGDRMSWKTKAVARCEGWISTEWFDFVEAVHDGYARLPDPVVHKRAILFDRRGFSLVFDRLSAKGAHEAAVHLHLHPDSEIRLDEGKTAFDISPKGQCGGERTVRVEFFTGGQGDWMLKVLRGDERARLAWHSPCYGTKTPSTAVRMSSSFAGEAALCCLIDPTGHARTLSFGPGPAGTLNISLKNADDCEEVLFIHSPGAPEEVDRGWALFKGKTLYARRGPGGGGPVWVGDFSVLDIAGRVSVRTKGRVGELRLCEGLCEVKTDGAEMSLTITDPDVKRLVVDGTERAVR